MGDLCNFGHRKLVNNNFFDLRGLCLRVLFLSFPQAISKSKPREKLFKGLMSIW